MATQAPPFMSITVRCGGGTLPFEEWDALPQIEMACGNFHDFFRETLGYADSLEPNCGSLSVAGLEARLLDVVTDLVAGRDLARAYRQEVGKRGCTMIHMPLPTSRIWDYVQALRDIIDACKARGWSQVSYG